MTPYQLELPILLPPIISPRDLVIRPAEAREWNGWLRWLRARHYLHRNPNRPSVRLVFGVFTEEQDRVGCLVWGRPVARLEDQVHTLELARMFLEDVCPRNSESYVLGRCVRWIRQHMPEIHRLIAYADPSAGHTGTIYRAVGWECLGKAGGRPWSNRPGRVQKREGHKVKFERVLTRKENT